MHLLWASLAIIATSVLNAFAEDAETSPKMSYPIPPMKSKYVSPNEPKYDYAEVLHKSYLFYHAQKSGTLSYQRMAWRGDSCKVCVGDFYEDLSRGWYEAANTMKWGLPFGWTATQLAFNIFAFEDAMNSVDELAEGLELIKWGADYLMSCHYNDTHIVGQLGTASLGPISKLIEIDVDFNYWGPPEEYEQWVPSGLPHKAYYLTPDNPSSEIAGEYAASMAAISIPWAKHNATFAADLVDRAKRLYKFATDYPGSYVDSKDNAFQWSTFWYPSSRYQDELAWGAAWIYAATKDPFYLEEAKRWYNTDPDSWYEYSWDEKGAGLHVLLYTLTKDKVFYKNAMMYFNQFLAGPEQTAQFTPRGLAYIDHWGSVGYSGNMAFLMLAFAKQIGYETSDGKALTSFAIQQINYVLGDYGYSWVIGFGDNYPSKPYHKSSYNSFIDYPLRGRSQDEVETDFMSSKTDQRFILYGALEGGPAIDDTWYDDRSNYEYSEVTQDYNAAWTGAVAGLIDFYGVDKFEPYSDCNLDLGWNHPNASAPPAWPADDCYHTCNKGCPRGQLKSSFSWRMLTEPDSLADHIETLYPGMGSMRAAVLNGDPQGEDPSAYDASAHRDKNNTPDLLNTDQDSPLKQQSTNDNEKQDQQQAGEKAAASSAGTASASASCALLLALVITLISV